MKLPAMHSVLSIAVLSAMCGVAFANTDIEQPQLEQKKSSQETAKLDTIVVTAGGYEQDITQAAASISVITAEELAKKSYSDVTDALKNVPGVYVTGGGSNQTVSIRGMGSAYTLYMIDGRPMNDGSLLTTNGGTQGASINFLPPIEAIERIEVIRGPSSSLYGSDAMGGVINIITKKHQDHLTGSIKTEYIKADQSNEVNNDATNTSIYVNAPLVDHLLSLQVNAGLQTTEESSLQKNNMEANESDPEFKKQNIAAQLVLTPNENNTLSLGYTHISQQRTYTPGKSLLTTTEGSDKELIKQNYTLAHEGDYEHIKTSSYLQYDKDENSTQPGRAVGNQNNVGGILFETLTANTQGTYFFDAHNLTVGATYKQENLEDGASNQNVNMVGKVTKMDRYQWSLFAEDTWNVTDQLALTLSGRFDENEKFGANFSPKAYAVYRANDQLTVKGGVISGYKAPSLRNSSPDYMLNSMGGAILPNPNLKPETSLTYEASIAYENGGMLNALTIYKTDFKDKITRSSPLAGSRPERDENGNIILSGQALEQWYENSEFYQSHPELAHNANGYTANYNIDEAEILGLEFTTDYQITDYLKYRHSYTYTDSEQKSGQYVGKPLTDVSKHMLNAGLDWEVNDQIALWTQVNYRSKTLGTTSDVHTPAYTFWDLGAIYKYDDQIQFATGIYNVANKNVLDDGNASVLDGRRYSLAMHVKF